MFILKKPYWKKNYFSSKNLYEIIGQKILNFFLYFWSEYMKMSPFWIENHQFAKKVNLECNFGIFEQFCQIIFLQYTI